MRNKESEDCGARKPEKKPKEEDVSEVEAKADKNTKKKR
jgi:hypothetical protein